MIKTEYDLSTKSTRYNALLEELKSHFSWVKEDIENNQDEISDYPKNEFYQAMNALHNKIEKEWTSLKIDETSSNYIYLGWYDSSENGIGYFSVDDYHLSNHVKNFAKSLGLNHFDKYSVDTATVLDIQYHLKLLTGIYLVSDGITYEEVYYIQEYPVRKELDFEEVFDITRADYLPYSSFSNDVQEK